MYSVLPAVIACVFLFYGLYVVSNKGINRVSTSFLILCIATFFWQFLWAVLFQVEDRASSIFLIKLGWLLILFLPTALYHFLTEITGFSKDLFWVYVSYGCSALLSLVLVFSDWLIDGYYIYFFGHYPKAGPLHGVHVMQTVIVVTRAFYVTYRKQKIVQAGERAKLRYCLAALVIYVFAAIDYTCNYGVEIYPPGVLFVAVALAIFAVATVKYHLMDNAMVIAASIAHELRTPLATIRLQAKVLSSYTPVLLESLRLISKNNLGLRRLDDGELDMLSKLGEKIGDEAKNANLAINMLLAIVGDGEKSKSDYSLFSVAECINNTVRGYPFRSERERVVSVLIRQDFDVFASETFFGYVVNNLLNNALHSILEKGEGTIEVVVDKEHVTITDTGVGITSEILPHIFDNYFTTKSRSKNAGIGLAFCRQTIRSFGGEISCASKPGDKTIFKIIFPVTPDK
ncbi:MAG: two-component system CAI-1 autoinducer sensor kinase/phosphatase CqsS [Lentisphaeria bacterium]